MSWTIACFCGHVYAFEGDCPNCGRALHEPTMPPPLSCAGAAQSERHGRSAPFVGLARYGLAAQRRYAQLVPRTI